MSVWEASEDFILRQALDEGRIYEGKVVQAPTTVSEGLLVRLSDGQLTYGPMPWPARGTSLPDVDDDITFTKTDQGGYICLSWWPFGEL